MKRTFTLLTLIFSLFTLVSSAQEKTGNIAGSVSDINNKKLEAATVVLSRTADSAVLKTIITDVSGNFRFVNLPANKYSLLISSVGHEPLRTHIDLSTVTDVHLDPIVLVQQPKALANVTVVSTKPFYE